MEVRKIIYATNAIESLHSQVLKSIRNKDHFPNDEAATNLLWLALWNITASWKIPPITWHSAKTQVAIQFGERFIVNTPSAKAGGFGLRRECGLIGLGADAHTT